MIRTILIFLVWVSIVPQVAGDIIYVNSTNIGAEDGLTQATGFNTIQEGVDDSNSEDTVFVLSGTYGAVTLNKTINLTGEIGSIINGTGSGRGIYVNITNIGNTNISGFEITNWAFGVHVYDVNAGNANLIIRDNNFSLNNDKGVFLSIGTEGTSIINNTIDRNYGGIGISCSSNNTIANNTIINSTLFGIDYSGASCADDLPINNTIEGNIIENNTEAGIYMIYTEVNTIHNNTIDNNVVSGIQLGHTYNNIFTNNTIRNNGVNSQCGVFLSDSINNTFRWSTIANNSFADVCAYGKGNTNNSIRDSIVDVLSVREIQDSFDGIIQSNSTIANVRLRITENDVEELSGIELNITKYRDPNTLGVDVLNTTFGGYYKLDTSVPVSNISNVIITIFYNEEDVIDEDDVKPYFYNETTSKWVKLTDQLDWVNNITMNITENSITLDVRHLSIYTLGVSPENPPPPPPSNGGGTVKTQVVIMANSIDYDLSTEFRSFLESQSLEVIYTTPERFSDYRDKRFIVILGGPDAYNGTGEIVQGILNESDQAFLRTDGNRGMYTKKNTWRQEQTVMVIAGSDREQTQKAGEENKLAVRKELKGY